MLTAFGLLAIRHLLDYPLRMSLTLLGVALGVAAPVAIRAANLEVLSAFQEAVDTVAGQGALQVSDVGGDIDERLIRVVRSHQRVVAALPVIRREVTVTTGPHRGKRLAILATDLLAAMNLQDIEMTAQGARTFDLEHLLDRQAIFVGAEWAEDWNMQPGDSFHVRTASGTHGIEIRGIMASTGSGPAVWESTVLMDIATAQSVFDAYGRLDRIEVLVEPSTAVEQVARELEERLPASVAVTRPSIYRIETERMIRAFQANLTALSAVGLLVGSFLVYNTIAAAVAQRRQEIGVLRSLGFTKGEVATLFVGEAGIVGLVGGAIGGGLGLWVAEGLVSMLGRTVSNLYHPVDVAAVDLPWGLFGQSLLLGVAVSIIGAAGPGWQAARLAPAQALAPGMVELETGDRVVRGAVVVGGTALLSAFLLAWLEPVRGLPVFGYASALCLLLGLACLAPLLVVGLDRFVGKPDRHVPTPLGRVAADQVGRAPGRNGVTISAILVSLALFLGVGIMVESFRYTVQAWMDQTFLADFIVVPSRSPDFGREGMRPSALPSSWRTSLEKLPGVAGVDPYRERRIEVGGQVFALVSRDLRLHADRSRYLFMNGNSSEILSRTAAQGGVVISEVLADRLDLAVGESLELETPRGRRGFPVEGMFYDYATDGGKVVMDTALYQALWEDPSATVLAVYLVPQAHAGNVRRAILDALSREGAVTVIRNGEVKAEVLRIFDQTFTLTYALELLAVLIAVLGVTNTLLIAVLERRQEIAVLRAIGASGPQVCKLVLWEAAYLGAFGAALGIVGGVLLSILLIEVVNKQSFGWTIQYVASPWPIVQAVGLAIGAAVLAGLLPALWAARRPLAEGLRYE